MAESYFKQKAHENRRAINILFHTYWLFKVIVNVELNVGVGRYQHSLFLLHKDYRRMRHETHFPIT